MQEPGNKRGGRVAEAGGQFRNKHNILASAVAEQTLTDEVCVVEAGTTPLDRPSVATQQPKGLGTDLDKPLSMHHRDKSDVHQAFFLFASPCFTKPSFKVSFDTGKCCFRSQPMNVGACSAKGVACATPRWRRHTLGGLQHMRQLATLNKARHHIGALKWGIGSQPLKTLTGQ